ncbi:MAG: DNA primase [Pseudomonadota bacterium]
MRFPPHILDDIRARLPVSQVVGRKVALKKKGREWSGLSPFKVERTPSFFVNDQKGFYHCFASGEHGDIFTFLMKTEGLSFPEAVERLAEEAGVPLPKPEARDAALEDERQRLYRLLEVAAVYFEDALKGSAGTEARAYLARRGLRRETIARFRIGYAPNSRSALKDHLAKAGFTLADMATSGMLISGADIPVAYDRFRNRVMFPILDLKGRVIAFGGRALDADAPAKYLNSPETPLFHKGHILFNAQRARAAAHDKGRVIAVEGYMDVVALAEAGFEEAVAPLGTAMTEDQLKLLWRMSPEPILCFDGDTAGRKAAHRAIDVALPELKPGVSLGFAFLPDGLDPDDLVRQEGAAAMEAVLARARPLADVLYQREWESGAWTTPERRARLEQQLRTLLSRIADPAVRSHYVDEARRRLAEAWGNGPRDGARPAARAAHATARASAGGRGAGGGPRVSRLGGPRGGGGQMPGSTHAQASSALRNSALVAGEGAAPPYREVLLLRTILNHPWLIDHEAEAIAELPLASRALARLRDGILSLHARDYSLDRASLRAQLSETDLGKVLDLAERAVTHKSDRFAEPDADRAEVEIGWRHTLALHKRQVGLRRSLEAAERDWHEDGSEEALGRICELQRLLQGLDAAGGLDGAGDEL